MTMWLVISSIIWVICGVIVYGLALGYLYEAECARVRHVRQYYVYTNIDLRNMRLTAFVIAFGGPIILILFICQCKHSFRWI